MQNHRNAKSSISLQFLKIEMHFVGKGWPGTNPRCSFTAIFGDRRFVPEGCVSWTSIHAALSPWDRPSRAYSCSALLIFRNPRKAMCEPKGVCWGVTDRAEYVLETLSANFNAETVGVLISTSIFNFEVFLRSWPPPAPWEVVCWYIHWCGDPMYLHLCTCASTSDSEGYLPATTPVYLIM